MCQLRQSRLTSNDVNAYFDRSKRSLRVGQRAYFGRSKTTLLKVFMIFMYFLRFVRSYDVVNRFQFSIFVLLGALV